MGRSAPPLELAREYPPPREQYHTDRLIDRLRTKMAKDYATGRMLRAAHPKMHGCVKASFIVEPGLDPVLRHGLFRQPGTYGAWLRFSNASDKVQADSTPDILGLGIKLMGVEGENLLSPEATTHDFALISHESFLAKDVAEFDAMTAALLAGPLSLSWFFLNPFDSHLWTLHNLRAAMRRHEDLLSTDYFSASPYLLGPHAVKYKLVPAKSAPDVSATPSGQASSGQGSSGQGSDDFLRARLARRLRGDEATFYFQVQRQVDADRMPIEDLSRTWDTRLSPFQTVATLKIPPQEFDCEQRRRFGDNLSYNPWRVLPEHRPLGGINRARRQVYQALSQFRHDMNQVPMQEPTIDDEP